MSGARETRTSAGRRTRVALTLAGVVVALLAPLAPAQAAAPTIAVSRSSVIGGESITVSGKTGQKKARSVVLQRQSGKTWVKVVASQSTTAGAYKFLYKPPTKVGSKVVLRVIAPKVKIGKTTYKQITSGGRSVTTVAQAGTISGADNVSQNAQFLVNGKFTPARTGRSVVIQKLVNGHFVSTGRQGLENSAGTVSIPISLTASGAVQLRLYAAAANGAPGVGSPAKTVTVFLQAPTGLTATAGNASAHLTWNAVAGSGVTYNVYQYANPSDPAGVKVNSSLVSGTSYDVSGLTNGVKYYFSVTTVSGTDESASSAMANATPVAPADTTPPPVPGGVTADPGSTSAQVSWNAVSNTDGDLAGYNVYRGTSSTGPWTKLTSSPISDLTYSATGLTNGTAYYFAVTSVDTHANESAKGVTASSVTPQPGADTTPPPVPAGVAAAGGAASAQVSWTAVVAGDLAGYKVYRATNAAGPWTLLTPNAIPDTTFAAAGLTNGTPYFFAVTSVDTSGNESAKSTAATATPVAGPASWSSVSAGRRHTCAVGSNGTLYCWGINNYGQLGNPTGIETGNAYTTPIRVGGATSWTSVAAGDDFTCGIQAPGTLWCWGLNTYGQLGNGDSSPNAGPTVTQVGTATNWASVSAGADHACATTTGGTVFCWGLNTDGQLGRTAGKDTLDPNPTPAQVGTDTNWSTVSAGEDHTCATKTDHTVYCWGSNIYGQLGSATNSGVSASNPTPLKVTGTDSWATVSAGDYGSCGVLVAGGLKCWGRNQFGQLASAVDSDDGPHATPSAVTGGNVWSQVSVGGGQVCAVRTDKTLYCWGRRDFGQVGSASATVLTTPTKVGTGNTWVAVDAGNGIDDFSGHTAAITTAGKVFTFGANQYGQLGRVGGTDTPTVGTTNPSPTPGEVPVPG